MKKTAIKIKLMLRRQTRFVTEVGHQLGRHRPLLSATRIASQLAELEQYE